MKLLSIFVGCVVLVGCGGQQLVTSPSKQAPSGVVAGSCPAPTIANIDVDMSAPKLVVDVSDGVVLDVERLDEGGWASWQGTPFTTKTINVWFEQSYRVRARFNGCERWSDWSYKDIGPANPCGSCEGKPPTPKFTASVCSDAVLYDGVMVWLPINIPAGSYWVDVTTKDINHHPGHQPDQTQEVITVQGIGTTEDIPEADTSHTTSFSVTLPTMSRLIVDGGRDSVHGFCITLNGR